MNAQIVMSLVGGLALFIYGIQKMGDGLQKIAGDRMRKVLEVLTTKPWRGAMVGAGVTALIQSSSATTVMLVGFVNAGLMNLQQAIGVIMGANVGTTITAQMIAFKIDRFALPAIAIGFALTFFSKRKLFKFIGETILGFGLLFFGLNLMKDAVVPLKQSTELIAFLTNFGQKPLLGVLAGMLITAVIQSSSATMGLVIAAATSGLLTINSAIPIVLGAEIGTCITAMLASIGTSLAARRSAVAHLMFNVLGTVIFLTILPFFIKMATFTSTNIARQIANAQTSLNIMCTLIGLPLVGLFSKVVTILVPGEEVIVERKTIYLDPHILNAPSFALGQTTKEIARMARLTLEMIDYDLEIMFNPKKNSRKHVEQREEAVDNLAAEITKYLTKVSQSSMSPEQSRRFTILMHVVNDVERIGDHAENIMKIVDEKNIEKIPFSKNAEDEIQKIHSHVKTMYSNMVVAFEEDDAEKAKKYQRLENKIDKIARNAHLEHIKRLKDGVCFTQAGIMFLDIINHYERIGDLANNLGYATRGEITKL
ncbi:Na/Pi cotransporter family protein [Candidatus Oleimmundimicrobium sp.]|uniref:Na/Pi cotransporter family protein n=1 Tax=Candidatus Oleimmundimicrobium sp. TaxID=3060597 RepID=UPI002722686E|nr:Na/Pi cotransporter family protein [Candidatus Oleimmundimicrobium sp.]MDO8885331.1 Na/Pi cotransporter family protein [Candidatus Oleimmundimicrobium sp.]